MADVCALSVLVRARVRQGTRITDALHRAAWIDPAWMLKSPVDWNPLVWMAEVNGLLVDLRDMPREVQEIAFAKCWIRPGADI